MNSTLLAITKEDSITPLSNVTEEMYYLSQERSPLEQGIMGLILLIIILTAVIGNLLVVVTVTNNHRLHEQVSNLFIINLCITDLSTTMVVTLTGFVAIVADFRSISSEWCNLVCAGNYCFIIVSMLTLSCVSVERLLAIYFPLKYNTIVTRIRVKGMCVYMWIQGFAFGLTPMFLRWIHYDYWEAICAIDWQKEKQLAVYYVIVAFVANFGVPGLIMLGCYIAIIREAKRVRQAQVHATNFAPPPPQGNAKDSSNLQARRALKTITSLLVVVLLFFIFMTPFCVTKLLKVIISDPDFVPPYINLLASIFGYLSSMVNPFIYAIFRKEFRIAFKLTIRKVAPNFIQMQEATLNGISSISY